MLSSLAFDASIAGVARAGTLDFVRQRTSARAGMARLSALVLLGPLLVLAVTLILLVELADLGGHGVRRPRVETFN